MDPRNHKSQSKYTQFMNDGRNSQYGFVGHALQNRHGETGEYSLVVASNRLLRVLSAPFVVRVHVYTPMHWISISSSELDEVVGGTRILSSAIAIRSCTCSSPECDSWIRANSTGDDKGIKRRRRRGVMGGRKGTYETGYSIKRNPTKCDIFIILTLSNLSRSVFAARVDAR